MAQNIIKQYLVPMAAKIVYSVTVKVEEDVLQDWLQWMQAVHIPDVMKTDLFESARLARIINSKEDGDSYSVQYICKSMAAMHEYEVKHAPALKQDHIQRYEGKFLAYRTLLEEVATY